MGGGHTRAVSYANALPAILPGLNSYNSCYFMTLLSTLHERDVLLHERDRIAHSKSALSLRLHAEILAPEFLPPQFGGEWK